MMFSDVLFDSNWKVLLTKRICMSSERSLKIHASVIHRIVKSINQKAPDITPPLIREKLHDETIQVEKLIDFLDKQLGTNGLAHSYSKNFSTSQTLANILSELKFSPESFLSRKMFTYQVEKASLMNFLDKSKFNITFLDILSLHSIQEDINVLKVESRAQTRFRRTSAFLTLGLNSFIYEESMTTGDHLPIIFYEIDGKQYLYIALLSLKDTITIDENTGQIIDTTNIDTSALKVACKINLDGMLHHFNNQGNHEFEPNNYISWIQKGHEKIAEYIQNFIPVGIRIDDKSATTKVMNSLIDFLKNSDFLLESREEIYKDVISLIKKKAYDKENLNILEEIDPIIEGKASTKGIDLSIDKNNFKIYRENNGYGANDKDNANIFSPEKKPLKNFEVFDIYIGDESEFLKISGLQSIIGNKIEFTDDPDNPKLEISLNSEEVERVRKIFNSAKPYES